MKLPNWFRGPTIGIVLIANCIQTVPAQVGSAVCNSLTDSVMLSSGSGPDMAADQLGSIHVVWQDPTLGVMYAQVGPDGTTIVPATSMYPSHGYGFPHIAVDNAGDAHIVATTISFSGIIYLKVSGGKRVNLNAFYINPTLADYENDSSPSITINAVTQLPVVAAEVNTYLNEYEGILNPVLVPVYSTFIASVALDASGNPVPGSVFEAWYDLNTQSPQFTVSYPSLAVDAQGVTHVVWVHQDPSLSGLTVGYANSAQTTFEEIANNANVAGLEGRPIIIRGGDGNLDVVWSTTANAVVWTQINPKGLITIDNAIVSQPEAKARWPVLAAASGKLVCSWTDDREGTNSQIYARSLLDTVPECNVSQSPGAASFGAVAIDSSGKTAFVWQDQRSGSAQLYYRATSLAFTVLDANPQFLHGVLLPAQALDEGTLSAIASASVERTRAAADGATLLLLRVETSMPGAVLFDQVGPPGGQLVGVLTGADASRPQQTVEVNGRHLAFALYRVPETVPLYPSNDPGAPSPAPVSFSCAYSPQVQPQETLQAQTSISLLPTPILLVHGLWGKPGDWSDLASDLAADAPDVRVGAADYSSSSSMSFAQNSGVVPGYSQQLLEKCRTDGCAVTRVDIVAHSMGGILTRIAVNSRSYYSAANFNAGYIRRFISVDTPHFGAASATFLQDYLSSFSNPKDLDFRIGWMSALGKDPEGGAVADLDPFTFAWSLHGVHGPACGSVLVPTHAIACEATQYGDVSIPYESAVAWKWRDDFLNKGLKQGNPALSVFANAYINEFDSYNKPATLTSFTGAIQLWATEFSNQPNDGTVEISSQIGRCQANTPLIGISHVMAPHDEAVRQEILNLLNGSVQSGFSSPGLPPVTQPDLNAQTGWYGSVWRRAPTAAPSALFRQRVPE